MSTALSAVRTHVNRDLNDDFSSALTSNGAADGTTLVDNALKAYLADWRNDQTYDLITSGTYINEERWCSGLVQSTGTMTMLAHGGQLLSAVTYELHRLFTASQKRIAIIAGCKEGWPHIFNRIRDENKNMGDWLLNGGMEVWTVATYPDNWRVSAVTAAANTNRIYLTRGVTSMKLSTAAGYAYQDQAATTGNPDLFELVGESITVTADVWCDTASCARLCIYDGVTTTYSDYHTGGSTFEELTVTATIAAAATTVSIRVYLDVLTGTAYVDNVKLTGPTRNRIYIGDLGLYQHQAYKVTYAAEDDIQTEPWTMCRNWESPGDGWLYINDASNAARLRIEGKGVLDFLASGVSSTAWTATVNLDDPQTRVLSAAACRNLYRQLTMPNYTAGQVAAYKEALKEWEAEFVRRVNRYPMPAAPATAKYTR